MAQNPGVAYYHAARGVALFEAGDLAESHQELDKALARHSQAAQAYLGRARVMVKQGQTAKALGDYETYTALVPDTAKAFQEEEALYRQAGQADKAADAHTKYVSLRAEKGEAERDPSFLINFGSRVFAKAWAGGSRPLGLLREPEEKIRPYSGIKRTTCYHSPSLSTGVG